MDLSMDSANIDAPGIPFHSPTHKVGHLLKLNHDDYSILYNQGHFHNHTPHFLAAAYLLGASANELDKIYNDAVSRDILEAWTPSGITITPQNHRDYLTKAEHQRAWVDFFDAETESPNQWEDVVVKLLLENEPKDGINSAPLLHCLIAGLGHPLIHLGYAFELRSREVAVEALSLAATCYDPFLASLLTASSHPSTNPTSDLFEILSRVSSDHALPAFPHVGDSNINSILENKIHLAAILTHLNSWTITNPKHQLLQAQQLASLILVETSPEVGGHGFDFLLVHVLTTAHAVGEILPYLPVEHHTTLLREWLLMTLLVYAAQKRPKLDSSHVTEFELGGRSWDFVRAQALKGDHSSDAHFVKACHAMMSAEDKLIAGNGIDKWFLKSAVRFTSEFKVWSGFDPDGEGAEETRLRRLKDGIHV